MEEIKVKFKKQGPELLEKDNSDKRTYIPVFYFNAPKMKYRVLADRSIVGNMYKGGNNGRTDSYLATNADWPEHKVNVWKRKMELELTKRYNKEMADNERKNIIPMMSIYLYDENWYNDGMFFRCDYIDGDIKIYYIGGCCHYDLFRKYFSLTDAFKKDFSNKVKEKYNVKKINNIEFIPEKEAINHRGYLFINNNKNNEFSDYNTYNYI